MMGFPSWTQLISLTSISHQMGRIADDQQNDTFSQLSLLSLFSSVEIIGSLITGMAVGLAMYSPELVASKAADSQHVLAVVSYGE